MNMKKYFAVILFSVFSVFAFSAELSFFLGDNTDLKFDGEEYKEPRLKQSEAFSALAKIPFNKKGTTFLFLEASLSHSYEKIFGDHENSENEFIADLNVLKFSSIMECSAGKFFLDAAAFSCRIFRNLFLPNRLTELLRSFPLPGLMFLLSADTQGF